MIIIKNLHGGRFGNKILHYNNLAQLAKELNTKHYIPRHDDYEIFNNSPELNLFTNHTNVNEISNNTKTLIIDKYKLITDKVNYLKELIELNKTHVLILEPCLGELFFGFNNSTRDIFNNVKYIDDSYNHLYDKKHCAIHFRGGDFKSWNPESILSPEYYLNAIEELKNSVDVFTLHTDDESLESVKIVKKYLKDNKLLIKYNNFEDSFTQDFTDMLYSDYIISSPSTFAICAGIMGREKEIIHSKKWVDSRVEKNDAFWIGVSKGGNDNYKIKKLI